MKQAMRYAFLKMKARTLLVFVRPTAALLAFESMLQLRPRDSYALASCAHLHASNNDFPQAIANLQALVQTAPGASAWFNLGFVLQQAGIHGEAEAAFGQALACDERLDRAWYGLGLALVQRRQFEQAVKAFKRAAALQPMSPHAWYRLAEAWMALGKNDEAREVLLHLCQFEPKVAAQLEREFFNVLREPFDELRTGSVEGSSIPVQQRLRQASFDPAQDRRLRQAQPERLVRGTSRAATIAPHAAP